MSSESSDKIRNQIIKKTSSCNVNYQYDIN